MIQNWSIRSRATHCAHSERAFVEGEVFHTAIYFDSEANGYVRRDVALDVWKQEVAERKPIAYWRTTYSPTIVEAKPEVTSKESAMALLQRFIEEDDPMTENARYILALMLERKRILSPTATKEVDGQKMLFYENKKTGDVFIVRDPDLLLSELAALQDEVAMLLGFGGPGAEAAKVAGMKFGPDGKLGKVDEAAPEISTPAAEGSAPTADSTESPADGPSPEAEASSEDEVADETTESDDAGEESIESSDEFEEESIETTETSEDPANGVEESSEESSEPEEESEALIEDDSESEADSAGAEDDESSEDSDEDEKQPANSPS
ncbi:MAG: hypothetical protein V4662_10400 [Verrucomicrobiota bacterium]